MSLLHVLRVGKEHEALVPGKGTFLWGQESETIVAQVVAGRIPVEADDGAVRRVGSMGVVLAVPELGNVGLVLRCFGEGDVPELLHRILVVVALDPGLRQLALGLEPAAHGGEGRMSANADLADILVVPEVTQTDLTVLAGGLGLAEYHRLRAPYARHDQALAVDHGTLAGSPVGEAGDVVVQGQLARIPPLNEAVGVPAW